MSELRRSVLEKSSVHPKTLAACETGHGTASEELGFFLGRGNN
jgi:CHAT domain-containing protein